MRLWSPKTRKRLIAPLALAFLHLAACGKPAEEAGHPRSKAVSLTISGPGGAKRRNGTESEGYWKNGVWKALPTPHGLQLRFDYGAAGKYLSVTDTGVYLLGAYGLKVDPGVNTTTVLSMKSIPTELKGKRRTP